MPYLLVYYSVSYVIHTSSSNKFDFSHWCRLLTVPLIGWFGVAKRFILEKCFSRKMFLLYDLWSNSTQIWPGGVTWIALSSLRILIFLFLLANFLRISWSHSLAWPSYLDLQNCTEENACMNFSKCGTNLYYSLIYPRAFYLFEVKTLELWFMWMPGICTLKFRPGLYFFFEIFH